MQSHSQFHQSSFSQFSGQYRLHIKPFRDTIVQELESIHRLPPTSLLESQECKVPSNYRPSEEVWSRKPSPPFRHMQVCEWAIGDGLVHPLGHRLKYLRSNLGGSHSHGKELPVCLRVQVTRIQWKPVPLPHIVVPVAL